MSFNALIGSLTQGDRASLGPHLKSVFLPAKIVLFEAGDLVPAVYFPVSAIISLVVTLSTGELVEAAMVGRDGVVGASSALDGKVTLSRAIVQIEGDALICKPEKLRRAAFQSESLISRLIRHEQTLFAQAQQSTACMAAHDVQSRMCRWLLRARDWQVQTHLTSRKSSCRDARCKETERDWGISHIASSRHDRIPAWKNSHLEC